MTLWNNQYVWIWLQGHARTTRSKCESCLLLLLLPHLLYYKASVFGAAPRGLPTSTRGDVTAVSPGQTAEYHHLHHQRRSLQAAQHSNLAWLLLRNPWRLCPSSRENVLVSGQQLKRLQFILSLGVMWVTFSLFFPETRKDEVCSIRSKFPNKLPVSFKPSASTYWHAAFVCVLGCVCVCELTTRCVFASR